MQFIGGAWPWPVGVLLVLFLRDSIGWRGIWIIIGIGALIIFVLRFTLPESPRWLATHGQGQRALDILQRMGLRTVPLDTLRRDAASDTQSDPIATVLREYPVRVAAGMMCFFAFFGIALGLGAWLPNILVERGFTIAKSLNSIFWITLAFPCASAFMMFSLEYFGRKRTAVVAFILTGVSALAWSGSPSWPAIPRRSSSPRCSRPTPAPPASGCARRPAGSAPLWRSRRSCGSRRASA
jgi:putative MFS transporter